MDDSAAAAMVTRSGPARPQNSNCLVLSYKKWYLSGRASLSQSNQMFVQMGISYSTHPPNFNFLGILSKIGIFWVGLVFQFHLMCVRMGIRSSTRPPQLNFPEDSISYGQWRVGYCVP
jgi:hypothetical protein